MYHSVTFWIGGNKRLGEMSMIHEIVHNEKLHLGNVKDIFIFFLY